MGFAPAAGGPMQPERSPLWLIVGGQVCTSAPRRSWS